MDRKTKIAKWFLRTARAAAAGAFVFSAGASLAWAAGDALTLHVTPTDASGPNAVNDLTVVPTATEGQVMLTWTAPADVPSGNVSGYEVRYATFPVAVSGSTTAWWNAAVSTAPVFTPSSAGSAEIPFIIDGLGGGATYYFAIRSRDAVPNWSSLDDGAVLGPQASAFPRSLRPAPVAGLLSLTLPDTSVNVNWNPVDLNVDGSAATDIADYEVRRSGSFNGPFNVLLSSGAATSGFSVPLASTAPFATEYVQILAVDGSGNTSDPATSNILEVTPSGIIGQLAVAPGTLSRSYVPASLMGELADNNLLMRMAVNTDPNIYLDPRVVASYEVSFVSPVQVVDKNFTLSRPAMKVTIASPAPLTDGSAGVLWWNGAAWVKMGQADVDELTDTVSFYTALPGLYQVRTFQTATSLTLDTASVFPRIFTPNGDGVNDAVLFALDNPNGSAIEGKIYDVGGNEIADLRPAGAGSPTPDTLSWNGRDRNGTLARAGIYIYLIKGEGKNMTGTVVVAK